MVLIHICRTDTEPAYFEAIKTEINRQFRNKIQLDIFGEGDNTVNLMERARKRALSILTVIVMSGLFMIRMTSRQEM